MIHDAAHYWELIRCNPGATVGFAIASNAVYAARFGLCETEHLNDEAWLSIAGRLKETYGDYLTAAQVLAEMKSCMLPEQ